MSNKTEDPVTNAAIEPPALILSFDDYEEPARRFADVLSVPFTTIARHRFPDGELKVRLPASLPRGVAVVCALDNPNEKLVELMLVASTARTLGVRDLTLVAPYLCYMRQDIAFRPGEAVSQRVIGNFLAELFDCVITVDPHLHRTSSLDVAVPARRVRALSAAALMGEFLQTLQQCPILVGPDAESSQWVRTAAASSGLDCVIGKKRRTGDQSVIVRLPEADLDGRCVVLLDDIASTGHTLAAAARVALEAGAKRVDVLVTHALFAADAIGTLQDAGIQSIWSTDSIVHSSNCIALAPLLARGTVPRANNETVS